MQTLTFQDLADRSVGFIVPEGMEAQAEVPILSELQGQGDVLIIPTKEDFPEGSPVLMEGIKVVQSEASANTHELFDGQGTCLWLGFDEDDEDGNLGVLTVPEGCTAYLIHTEEHGANGFAPGRYIMRAQFEMRDQLERVLD